MAHIKIGELLVRTGHLTEEGLRTALEEQKRWGGRLGRILRELGLVSGDLVLKALTKQLGLPRADLTAPRVPAEILAQIDARSAMENRLCPERYDEGARTLIVAMEDHLNVPAIDDVATRTGLRVKTSLALGEEIDRGLALLFPGHPVVQPPTREAASPGQVVFDTSDFARGVEVTTGQRPDTMAVFETADFGAAAGAVRDEDTQKDRMKFFGTDDFSDAAAQVRTEPKKK